jgi:hypothetical protein
VKSRSNGGRTQYVPKLPRELTYLKARIITAVKNINAPILTLVWHELEIRIDVCRVTRGAHIEHLYLKKPFRFSCGCEQFYCGFIVTNVCNHGEHCETRRI